MNRFNPSSIRSVVRALPRIAATAMVFATVSAPTQAAAILFAHVNSSNYIADGNGLASMLSAGGHTVTTRFLSNAVYDDYSSFSQIFVYDLSAAADNSATQMANYANIAAWYNGLTNQNLILDGRIISSYSAWTNANGMSAEDAWIRNYASELEERGGGLVLGTDHDVYQSGINTINAGINVTQFSGFFGSYPTSQAVVDSLSPLYLPTLDPCRSDPTMRCINDNSTTGFVATGLQANGQTLTPVAYHGNNLNAWDFAAVSSTFGSRTFGTCGNPGQPACEVEVPTPGTAPLMALGLALLAFGRRRIRNVLASRSV